MLWSRPSLAHRPIVPGVNFTFDDARRPAASDREIQSDGGFGIGQSESLDAAAPALESGAPVFEPDALEFEPADGAALSADSALGAGAARPLPPEGSLRAQPVPLKWTAGAEMDFLICPWHLGHSVGPCPWTECLTSISWPQFEQM